MADQFDTIHEAARQTPVLAEADVRDARLPRALDTDALRSNLLGQGVIL